MEISRGLSTLVIFEWNGSIWWGSNASLQARCLIFALLVEDAMLQLRCMMLGLYVALYFVCSLSLYLRSLITNYPLKCDHALIIHFAVGPMKGWISPFNTSCVCIMYVRASVNVMPVHIVLCCIRAERFDALDALGKESDPLEKLG